MRKQNKKSLAVKTNPSESQKRRRRARSHSGPINFVSGNSPLFRTKKLSVNNVLGEKSDKNEKASFRRKSLQEFRQRRKISSRSNFEVSLTPSPPPSPNRVVVSSVETSPSPSPREKRQSLKKQSAVDRPDEDFDFDEEMLQMKQLPVPERKTGNVSKRAISLSASSPVGVLPFQQRSPNSIEDDFSSSVFSSSMDKSNSNHVLTPKQRISLAVMTAMPVIAITAAPSPTAETDEVAKNNRPPTPPTPAANAPERRSQIVVHHKTSRLAPPMRRTKSALSRTASIESDMSVLSSPCVLHEPDGRMKIFDGRHRSMPRLLRPSITALIGGRQQAQQNRRRNEAKTAKKSSYVVLAFLVFWLPFPICVGLSHRYLNDDTFQWYVDVQLMASCFGMLTVVTNPIIYGLAIKSFRVAFKKLMRSDWKRIKSKFGC